MATTRETLRLVRDLRAAVGAEADDAVRSLTRAWVQAWSGLAADFRAALRDVTDFLQRDGCWPLPWELARITSLRRALDAAEAALLRLAEQTGTTVTTASATALSATLELDPLILASQLPAGDRAATSFGALLPATISALTAQADGAATGTSWPIANSTHELLRRDLIRGVPAGTSRADAARQMLTRTRRAFESGLTRAIALARTQTLDAYRATARALHLTNRPTVVDWRWMCALNSTSCPACWGMHGTVHPVSQAGPWDHPQGHCVRVPLLAPWSELGYGQTEPDPVFPDAGTVFAQLNHADQLAVMGPARLELLQSGRITFADLAYQRDNRGWRPSYAPRPVTDLRRLAATPA